MIGVVPTKTIYLACGATDMRKGIDGLAVLVQEQLARDPHSGSAFVFRGKRGHLLKILSYDGQGMCLFYKRLDRGIFVWPWTDQDVVSLTPAQLSMLLEGIDWRKPERTWRPSLAG
jgi:transposase